MLYRSRLSILPCLFLLAMAAGCDTQDQSDETEVWVPTGFQVFAAVGDKDISARQIGPFAAATRVSFQADARGAAAATGEGTLTIRVLLGSAVLCENTQQGTGNLLARAECAADFSARESKSLRVEVVTTNVVRQGTSVAVEW